MVQSWISITLCETRSPEIKDPVVNTEDNVKGSHRPYYRHYHLQVIYKQLY